MIGAVILQFVLIFLNAVFASAEIAVISSNETKLNKLAEKGNKRAKTLVKLTKNPAKFLSTIQVAITLSGFLGSAFAADNFAGPLVNWLVSLGVGVPKTVLNSVCVVLITIVLAYFNIVLGELVPKQIAMRRAEKTALGISDTLKFVSFIFAPIVWLLTVSTNGLLKLLGINPQGEGGKVTEEEIMMMVEAGHEGGVIDSEENEFVKNVFDFKEQTVGEVCTHRKDTEVLFLTESDEEWQEKINGTVHTYYPVCGNTIDDVKHVLNTKDYFRLKDKSKKNVLKNAVSPAVFTSESTYANVLFNKMKSNHEYFYIVVDEYGGFSGIVTLHDLIELIVGDLVDKGEGSEYEIKKTGDNEWEISGPAPIDKVEQALNLNIPDEEKEEFETFGGYVLEKAEAVPEDGTFFETEVSGVKVRVLDIEDGCIKKMTVKLNLN